MKITIAQEDPYSPDAMLMVDELSGTLESITGNSGRASYDPAEVCGPRAVFAVARNQEGEPVGCGALRPIDDTTAEVKRMYAKIKSGGIGTQMLAYLEEQALKLGYSVMWIETRLINHKAARFYENRGYLRIPNYGKYVNRPEAVCFERKL